MWLFHSKQQTFHKFHKRRAKILIIQTTPQTVTIQKLNISLRNNKSKENRQMGIPENYKRTKKISTKFTNYSTRQKKFRPLKHPTKTILRQHSCTRKKQRAKSKITRCASQKSPITDPPDSQIWTRGRETSNMGLELKGEE